MDEAQVRKLVRRLSGREIEHLRRLLRQGTGDVREFASAQALLKSLEVHDLVFCSGSVVSLTHRGKLVARHL
jgi:hypothetical protein